MTPPRPTRSPGLAALSLILVLAILSPLPAGAASPPIRITVEPAEIALEGTRARQQVAVTGHFGDGSVRDLSGEARFQLDRIDVASVSANGVVTPRSNGQARLHVEAAGQAAE